MSDYRRVCRYWLGLVAKRLEDVERSNSQLYSSLQRVVKGWESIDENDQVPEELNINEIWEEARKALDNAIPNLFEGED